MVLCETGKKKLLDLISPKLIWEMEGYSWLWIVIIHTRMYLSHIQTVLPWKNMTHVAKIHGSRYTNYRQMVGSGGVADFETQNIILIVTNPNDIPMTWDPK